MNYQDTLDYMYNQLPMFHRIGKDAYKADLSNALSLDNHYNHPHKHYKTIHVAGTNGKGSVSHSIAAVLQSAGYKTGLFTSPHLKDFRERIRVNGKMIPEETVTDFISKGIAIFDSIKPSFFEMTSALAFEYFAMENVDIAVIEVGMGGRLDSTNIISPVLSVITNIGLDHTEFLGNTLEQIAGEKAGIIKNDIPVVIGEYQPETWPVFELIANKKNSAITIASNVYNVINSNITSNGTQAFTVFKNDVALEGIIELDLLGYYQKKNICTILSIIDNLCELGFDLSSQLVRNGLKNVVNITGLQGRWQVLGNDPLIVCDTGHNKHGLTIVIEQLLKIPYNQLHMVIGFVNDKDVIGILALLPADAIYYFTQASIPRAMDSVLLKEKAGLFGLKGETYITVDLAYQTAKTNAKADDIVFIGGSNFVVAEIL